MKFLFAMSISGYLDYYLMFIKTQWRSMSPTGYLTLLILVSSIGWVMMKTDFRKE